MKEHIWDSIGDRINMTTSITNHFTIIYSMLKNINVNYFDHDLTSMMA